MPSSLGQNSSGNLQAIIKVAPEGCLTLELAELLTTNFKVEFPQELLDDGRIDILSATALEQITTQLSNSTAFQTLVANLTASAAFVDSVVAALLVNEDFLELVSGGALENEDKQVLCGSVSLALDANLVLTVPVEAITAFAFTFTVIGDDASLSDPRLISQTTNTATIKFPNASAGTTVNLNWTRCLLP